MKFLKPSVFFFQTHHKSFGIKITITKNIPLGTGLQTEEQMIDTVLEFLYAQYSNIENTQKFTSKYQNNIKFLYKNNSEKLKIITFPKYKITKNWVQKIFQYLSAPENKEKRENLFHTSPRLSLQENIIFSYYPDIFTKYENLQKKYHATNTQIGLVGAGSALYIYQK